METKTYWFAKQGLEGYANPTEPNLYPHAFEAMVKKEAYDSLKLRLKNLQEASASLIAEAKLNSVRLSVMTHSKMRLENLEHALLLSRSQEVVSMEELEGEL